MQSIKNVLVKLSTFFEDSDGRFSSSRLMGAILVIAYVWWASQSIACGEGIPDVPLQLAGLVVTLYGINKVSGALKGKS